MSDLTVVGPLALPAGASATLTVRYPPGWRDTEGRLSAGTYVGRYVGGAWSAFAGGALNIPAGATVACTLVVMTAGLPPAVQSFARQVRDTGGGAWDFTVLDSGTPAEPPAPTTGGAVPGAPGEPGPAGTSFRQGAGPPSDLLGRDDDSYLDSTTGDLYHKQAGHWTLTGNLRGRAGNNGTDGAVGGRGPAGSLRPLPVLPEQELYVPVASETAGGDGWSWQPAKNAGLWLSGLKDVDLSTPPTDGQALVWNAAAGKWRPGAGSGSAPQPFAVTTDADGFETITNADAITDADGYQTITNGTATPDADGYETVERSTP